MPRFPSQLFRPFTRITHTPSNPNLSTSQISNVYQRDTRLLNLDALLPGHQVTDYQRAWFTRVNTAVRTHMNGPLYDTSHDYEHCLRVVTIAHRLWLAEKHKHWARDVDPLVIFTAALVHDVGDDKYDEALGMQDAAQMTHEEKRERQRDVVRDMLDHLKCPPQVAGPAAEVASFVSFARERDDPESLKWALEHIPALRIVQDADRLDALGPMGITRCSVYGGVSNGRRHNTIMTIIELIDDRFVHYPGMMKTKAGRKEAKELWKYMVEYKKGMQAQADCEGLMQVN